MMTGPYSSNVFEVRPPGALCCGSTMLTFCVSASKVSVLLLRLNCLHLTTRPQRECQVLQRDVHPS